MRMMREVMMIRLVVMVFEIEDMQSRLQNISNIILPDYTKRKSRTISKYMVTY